MPELIGEELVLPPHEVILPSAEQWVGAGTGWGSYGELMEPTIGENLHAIHPQCLPDASAIAKIAVLMLDKGQSVSAAQAVPVYLRNNVAKTTKEREQEKL